MSLGLGRTRARAAAGSKKRTGRVCVLLERWPSQLRRVEVSACLHFWHTEAIPLRFSEPCTPASLTKASGGAMAQAHTPRTAESARCVTLRDTSGRSLCAVVSSSVDGFGSTWPRDGRKMLVAVPDLALTFSRHVGRGRAIHQSVSQPVFNTAPQSIAFCPVLPSGKARNVSRAGVGWPVHFAPHVGRVGSSVRGRRRHAAGLSDASRRHGPRTPQAPVRDA
jgi:hypothetical protein